MQISKTQKQLSFSSRYHNFFKKTSTSKIKPRDIKRPYIHRTKSETDVFDKNCIEKLEMPQRLEIPRDARILDKNTSLEEVIKIIEQTRVKTNGVIIIRQSSL